jgi:hypothetical protein
LGSKSASSIAAVGKNGTQDGVETGDGLSICIHQFKMVAGSTYPFKIGALGKRGYMVEKMVLA